MPLVTKKMVSLASWYKYHLLKRKRILADPQKFVGQNMDRREIKRQAKRWITMVNSAALDLTKGMAIW